MTATLTDTPMLLSVFLYGTLKRDFYNHDDYCRGFVECQSATIAGQLRIPSSEAYPYLTVPDTIILVRGSEDLPQTSASRTLYPLPTTPISKPALRALMAPGP